MSGGDGFFFPLGSGDSVLDWVSVADHGATGDGSTDDTSAIQAALNATPAGGVCYFPVPATYYKITAALSVPRTMRLAGGGSFIGRYTRIHQATANTTVFVGPSTLSQHILVEGLHITGTIGSQTGGAAIDVSQSVHVARCYISGFQDGLRVTVDNVDADAAYYCTVEHSFFDSATRSGVRLNGIINNFTWIKCRANSNGTGVTLGGPFGAQFFGGAIEANTVGLDIDGDEGVIGQDTASVLIAGTYFEQYDGMTDIRIGNDATPAYSVRIEACPFIRPNLTGSGWHINAISVNGLTVTDCTFSSSQAVQAVGSGVIYGRNHNINGGTVTLPSGSIRLDAANVSPEPVGETAVVGTSHYLARADHVHEGATDTGVTVADVRDAGRWEVVVDGSPAEAVTTPDGTDWVYGWITT